MKLEAETCTCGSLILRTSNGTPFCSGCVIRDAEDIEMPVPVIYRRDGQTRLTRNEVEKFIKRITAV